MNIILDSNIFELADNQTSDNDVVVHLNYLSDLLDFLKSKCRSHKIVTSKDEYCILCTFCDHPWNQYPEDLTRYNALGSVFQDYTHLMTCCNDCTVSFNAKEVVILNSLSECSKNGGALYKEFLRHLYCIRASKEHIVFMGTANHSISLPLQMISNGSVFDFYPILDINDEEVKYFSEGYRHLLILQGLILPTLDNPLPNKKLCDYYLILQNKLISNGNDPMNIYLRISNEVALRNGYIYSNTLSKKNSTDKTKRVIYKHQKEDIYLSVDVEHGAFEVCNGRGRHCGEYSYIGKMLQPRDKTGNHDINV